MGTKFTPGPWAYRPLEHDDWGVVRAPEDAVGRRFDVANARAGGVHVVADEHRAQGTDPYEANARLIAAAPALFEALDEVVRTILTQHELNDIERATLAKARAALAAATSSVREGA